MQRLCIALLCGLISRVRLNSSQEGGLERIGGRPEGRKKMTRWFGNKSRTYPTICHSYEQDPSGWDHPDTPYAIVQADEVQEV
jgi:hypothetical protein